MMHAECRAREIFVFEANIDAGLYAAAGRSLVQKRPDLNFVVVDVGLEFELLDVQPVHRLQPDRLPDAGRSRIKDRCRVFLPVLLSARKRNVPAEILGANDNRVVSLPKGGGNVRLKRRMPPFVIGHLLPVHPYGGCIVHRAEVKKNRLTGPTRWKREAPLVPYQIVKSGVANAAQPALVSEGNLNAPGELLRPRGPSLYVSYSFVVEFKLPRSVKIEPLLPDELRARILRSWHRLSHS